MSVRVMALVWEYYPCGGSEFLAMLALADWSDDEGRCFPSIQSIAKKIRLKERQAQRVVHTLIAEGFVLVTGNELGGAPGSSRRYRLNLSRLTGVAHDTPTGVAGDTRQSGTGVMEDADGCHPRRETGVTHDTLTVSEPSVNHQLMADEPLVSSKAADPCPHQAIIDLYHQTLPATVADSATRKEETSEQTNTPLPPKQRQRKSAQTLSRFLEDCRQQNIQPIDGDDPIFDYAEKVGISEEMLKVAWEEFKSSYLPKDSTQKDWRAHYRNAVKRNWYGLWFLKEGEVAKWTTAGEQARRAAA